MPISNLSDSDLEELAKGDKANVAKLSDAALEVIALPQYDPMGGLESSLLGAGEAATAGYLPQVAGAIQSRSVSGPGYEAAKEAMRQRLSQADPALRFAGGLAGSTIPGVAMGKLAGTGGLLRQAAIGAGYGGLQNPESTDVSLDQLQARMRNAKIGGAVGLGAGLLGKAAEPMASQAETRGFMATRPFKKGVRQAMQRDQIKGIGRELLDQGIIGNIPRGPEKLLERTESAIETVGARKGEIIKEIQKAADNFAQGAVENSLVIPGQTGPQAKVKSGLDVAKLRQAMKEQLSVDPNLPDAELINDKLDAFVNRFAKGRDLLPLDEADRLKIELGKNIKNWYSKPGSEPIGEKFNKELYRKLNQGIDETAEFLAEQVGAPTGGLKAAKKSYGNLSAAAENLKERQIADTANRMISPSDYGAGSVGTLGALMTGQGIGGAAAYGAGATALNNFLRKYGSQLSAKQLDNLSKVVASPMFQNIAITSPIVTGVGQIGRAKNRIKAIESGK